MPRKLPFVVRLGEPALEEALYGDWPYILADPRGYADVIAEHLRSTRDPVACLMADWIDPRVPKTKENWKIEFVRCGGRGKRITATLNKLRREELRSFVRVIEQAEKNRTHGWHTRVISKAAKAAGVSISTINRATRERKKPHAKRVMKSRFHDP
jgi:uncharacterized protein (UPF0335 family)